MRYAITDYGKSVAAGFKAVTHRYNIARTKMVLNENELLRVDKTDPLAAAIKLGADKLLTADEAKIEMAKWNSKKK